MELDKASIRETRARGGWPNCSLKSVWAKLTESNKSLKKRKIADLQEQFRSLATPRIEVANRRRCDLRHVEVH
jgi:hypothetical protein